MAPGQLDHPPVRREHQPPGLPQAQRARARVQQAPRAAPRAHVRVHRRRAAQLVQPAAQLVQLAARRVQQALRPVPQDPVPLAAAQQPRARGLVVLQLAAAAAPRAQVVAQRVPPRGRPVQLLAAERSPSPAPRS